MDDSNSNNDDGNNDNWLGFSLSPHMKMEPPHHHHNHHEHDDGQVQDHHNNLYYHHSQQGSSVTNTTVPTSFYWENSVFHSLPLSMMPLKSDGSLCIIEALNKSQTQVMMPSSSPKLEDFLGGATIGSDQYGGSEREAMALSLDSIYYNQNAHESQTSRDFLSDPFRQHPYYSGLACNSIYQTPLDEEQETKQPHVTVCSSSQMPQVGDEGTACFKNWEQQVNNSTTSIGNDVIASGSPSGSIGVVGRVSSAQHCGNLQPLSLSMSPVSQSNCVTVPSDTTTTTTTESVVVETKKRGSSKLGQKHTVHRKSIDTFGQRTSQYRGVTRHRWTGRYEAHLWDNSCKKEGQTRKGRQGGYDMEEKAARAYDLAALKYWGSSTHINFPLQNYQMQLEEMKNMSRQEFVAHLRRKSSGFSRGASIYRGVTRHHQHGRWQARIGRVAGNKDLYLGTFSTQEEAAEAYDVAAIKFRGVNAVTNFDTSRYHVENIMASNTLLTGEQARRYNKDSEPRTETIEYNVVSSQINNKEELEASNNNNNETNGPDWKMVLYHQSQQQQQSDSNSCDQKAMNCGNYRNPAFSMALHGLIGTDSVGSSHQTMLHHDSTIKVGTHFSNQSSLVTNLSSSRECSTDKTGPTLFFPDPPIGSTKIVSPIATTSVSSWYPSPAISMSHLPVFAAWNDA
ncbi:unnamed protein product [Lupinus luteus]|uniref:AP2/ERF domain-containing protein n=1 Tax=Lupinus luteus TaxID=3873 RepID=A0AAV1XLG6_LUPLU